MTISEIVKKYLADNGYDGLVLEDGECGCTLDDFQPCGEDFGGCEPAYKGPGIPGECDFLLYRKKPLPSDDPREMNSIEQEQYLPSEPFGDMP